MLKGTMRDSPGGSVVKNPTAKAGDMGLIPDLGRSHMLRSNEAIMHHNWVPAPRAHALQQKLPQWETSALQLESDPRSLEVERGPRSNKDPAQPKINK